LQIVVNGEAREVVAGTTVARLIVLLELPPRFLAVERNLEIIPREQHAECFLNEGDRLEIVTLVGGG
jgi:sulfur carrier protein